MVSIDCSNLINNLHKKMSIFIIKIFYNILDVYVYHW